MKYFIKIWPDKTATLVTNQGMTLLKFDSLEEAQHTLRRLTSKPTPKKTTLTSNIEQPRSVA